MTAPLVIFQAHLGGVFNRFHGCFVDAPGEAIYQAFLKRLRVFGFHRIIVETSVFQPAWMNEAGFAAANERARAFLSQTGLPGDVYAFPQNRCSDEAYARMLTAYRKEMHAEDQDAVLRIDLNALFLEKADYEHLLDHIPEGAAEVVCYNLQTAHATAQAYRFRWEKEWRAGMKPVFRELERPVASIPPPLPPTIHFSPCAAFEEVLQELCKVPDGCWKSDLLGKLWQERPEIFRRHYYHLGVELTNEDNLPDRVRAPRRLAPGRKTGQMAPETWERLLAQQACGPLPLSLDFWDFGEPLLHPHAVEWIGQAVSAGVRVDLRTNGRLIDADLAERLVAAGPDAVFLRLDAATPEGYRRVNGPEADFAVAQAGLENLLNAKKNHAAPPDALGMCRPIIAVELTEMEETEEDVEEFLRRYDHRNATIAALKRTLNRAPQDQEIMRDLYRSCPAIEYAIYRHDNLYRGRVSRPQGKTYTPLARFLCRQLYEGPYVLWDGTIVPCREDIESQHPLGCVLSGVQEAWRGATALFAFHEQGCKDTAHFCFGCGEWYYPFA